MPNCLNKLKTLIPWEEVEHSAQAQMCNYLKQDFCLRGVALPDIHPGYSLPVGGVVLLQGVISPAAVGADIGCGMCCIITEEPIKKLKDKDKIFKKIYDTIPVGFNCHSDLQDYPDFRSSVLDKELDKAVNSKLKNQLGTLGGGNHFIEIGENKKGNIAITIHSGSRNAGKQIYDYYKKLAINTHTELGPDFLAYHTREGAAYEKDMNFMLEYALENRKRMMMAILDILKFDYDYIKTMINENHNHAEDTSSVYDSSIHNILHRKGATPANLDQLGIIPGNMRDGTFITKGLGNNDYLCSASHGAGRKGSRSWAKQHDKLEVFEKMMKGVTAKVDKHTLDEAPWAYKDINKVIERQVGIVVDIVDHIKPLINIKG